MSDVEKYGLVAVVFVGGLLLVIATQGGFGGGAESLAPEVIDSAAPMRTAAPRPGENTVRVVSVLPDTPFRWDEPPVPYPGRRSVDGGTPAAAGEAAAKPAGDAAKAKPESAAARPKSGTHVVAKGETLEDIALEHLGSKTRWKELVALNPGLDPRKMQIGQVLQVAAAAPPVPLALASRTDPAPAPTLPVAAKPKPEPAAAKSAPASAAPAKGRKHTVAKGDTLGAIARKYLGSSARADEIYKANTDVLKTRDDLSVGQVLRIP